MPKTIKNWPATVRELGDMAEKNGVAASEMLHKLEKELGPLPMPPEGYTLAPGCSDHWIGTETMNRGWIITPAWNATTDTHSIELWAANHEPPNYATLTPTEALKLAADLLSAATALPGGKN